MVIFKYSYILSVIHSLKLLIALMKILLLHFIIKCNNNDKQFAK